MARHETCIYCGERATLLCDYLLGFTDPDGDGLYSTKDNSQLLRCDAPLCMGHAAHQGNIFACGAAGFFDSFDHCVGHQGDGQMQPMTTDAAQAIRYRHRCLAAGGLKLV